MSETSIKNLYNNNKIVKSELFVVGYIQVFKYLFMVSIQVLVGIILPFLIAAFVDFLSTYLTILNDSPLLMNIS